MKEGLDILFALQQLDNDVRKLETSLTTIPQAIKTLEDERDGKVSIIENTKAKLKLNAKERERFEKEILLVKEKIKKYQDQMSKATTNKEYQGFIAEIKYEEDSITAIEEKVIEKMLESDEIMNEIRQSEEEFNKISGEYNQKITDLTKNIEQSKRKVQAVTKQKDTLRAKIHKKLLRMYDSLAKNKHGVAVSLVESEFCGVCNVKIRPQRVNELIASKDISFCESCGRILFKKPEVNKEDNETIN